MKKLYLTLILSGMGLGVLPQGAPADEWNKLTTVTFNQPVELPGMTLPAGTYEFRLLDSPSDRDIVQIFNSKQTHLEDTLLAIPDQRYHATGKTVIQFYEAPAGQPQAIKAWFYPGSHTGLAFVYPHDRAAALAKASGEPVYETGSDATPYSSKEIKAGDPDATNMKHSHIRSVQPNGTESDVNQ